MPPVVLLVRHGDTEWSRSGQHTSRTDLPLLADGEAAAEALGRRFGRGAVDGKMQAHVVTIER